MGNPESKEFDVQKAWKEEEKLSLQERRSRYRCGTNFIEQVRYLVYLLH